MRIIFITNNYTPYSGGIVSSIESTTRQLRALGHDICITSLDFLGTPAYDHDYVVRIPSPIRFFYKTNHMAIPWRPGHHVSQLIKKFSPDIIHLHHPFLLGTNGLNSARTLNIPCVFTYHTMYEQYAHYAPVPAVCSQPIIRLLVDRFCKSVDGIIAPSSTIKKHIRARGVLSPIEIIPSGLQEQFICPNLHSSHDPQSTFFELLLVTRFAQEKNIPFVFDLFKRLPPTVRLTLVGYGPEYQTLHKQAFEEYKLPPERVRFIHKPSPELLLNIYRSCHLFIFPSQTDTQGLVMTEALSQGLPVVALDGPGQRDIIINGINGFIVHDINQATHTICMLMNNQNLYNCLVIGAKQTAAAYHPEHITKRLISFYNQIIG